MGLKDEQGAIALWFLTSLPLFFAMFLYLTTWHLAVTTSDVNLIRGLEGATKAAAMQVTPDSQAAGVPHISSSRAFETFVAMFAKNMGLNPGTFEPLPGSLLASPPGFILVVYNGDDAYSSSGAPKCTVFSYSPEEGMAALSLEGTRGFPQVFTVASGNIVPGESNGVRVRLESPGVIAVVKVRGQGIVSPLGKETVRWAAARVVRNPGF